MKTTTVRELRNNCAQVIRWVGKGEEVEVTRRGKVVARVVPAAAAKVTAVDWSQSAAHHRPAWGRALTAKESAALLADSQGN
jgi:prevent-host-death family protein